MEVSLQDIEEDRLSHPSTSSSCRRMSRDNPAWGEDKIDEELRVKFGISHSTSTIRKYMTRGQRDGQPWRTFIKNHSMPVLGGVQHDYRLATAIANPEKYGPEDIKGLFIRRFKKDIQDQVKNAFKKRKISIARARATAVEEEVYEAFVGLRLSRIDKRRVSGQQLFKTSLEKGLFSSRARPPECSQKKDRLYAGDATGILRQPYSRQLTQHLDQPPRRGACDTSAQSSKRWRSQCLLR